MSALIALHGADGVGVGSYLAEAPADQSSAAITSEAGAPGGGAHPAARLLGRARGREAQIRTISPSPLVAPWP